MDSFLHKARRGTIDLPHQRSFTIDKWHTAYKAIHHPTDADRALYESGLLIYERLVVIRHAIDALRLDEIDGQTLAHLVCGSINLRNLYLLHISYDWLASRDAADESVPYHQLLHGLQDDGGYTGMNLNGMLELIVDGARFPLRMALATSREYSSLPAPETNVEPRVNQALVLGQVYMLYEEAMERCIWCDWHVEREDDVIMIRPRFIAEQIRTDIARLRRQEMAEISIIQSIPRWITERPREEREALVLRRGAIHVELENSLFRCSLVPSHADVDDPPILLLSALVALDAYPYSLVNDDFDELGSVPITRLLNAWLLLESIAHAPAIEPAMTLGNDRHLLSYAPQLLKDDLERCIAESQRISLSRAKAILQQLTYTGTRAHELWNRPLIEIDENILVPVLPVLTAPMPFLLIQKWLRDAKINPDIKGQDFEEYVRAELAYAFASARIIRRGGVFSGRARTNDAIGDIDLLFWFGNTLVICEVKSTVVPDTPRGEHNFHQLIAGARDQAATKAAFVRDNIQAFLHRTGIQLDSARDIHVHSLVLTSMTHTVGGQEGEIPCTDLITLLMFICLGEAAGTLILDITGKVYRHDRVQVYESEEEAEKKFVDYFQHPPQFDWWLDRAIEEYQPLLPLRPDDEQWRLWYVRLAEQEIPKDIAVVRQVP